MISHVVNRRCGAVLLMTLSIMLVLSIALMKTFENRSLEIAHISNTNSTFQARMLGRSIFRGILKGLQEKGLFAVKQYLTQFPENVPVPVLNGAISNLTIEPVDHRLNLYWTFHKNSADAPFLLSVFTNLVNQIKNDRKTSTEQTEPAFELSKTDTAPIFNAIYDWQDEDDIPVYLNNDYGIEQYPSQSHQWNIKNRKLDLLSEIKLIPAFQKLNLTNREIRKNFIVTPGQSKNFFINVNLITKHANTITAEDKEKFFAYLERFKDIPDYSILYDYKSDIFKTLTRAIPTFSRKYETLKDLSKDLKIILGEHFSKIIGFENNPNFFHIRSTLIAINYQVHVQKTILQVHSLVELEYKGDSFTITGFKIHQFKLD